MNQRCFRCLAGDAAYENIRLTLDAAFGHEPPKTCIDPAAVAVRDTQGRIMLATWETFCDYPAVAAVLPGLLADGVVEEISEDEYRASLPKPTGP